MQSTFYWHSAMTYKIRISFLVAKTERQETVMQKNLSSHQIGLAGRIKSSICCCSIIHCFWFQFWFSIITAPQIHTQILCVFVRLMSCVPAADKCTNTSVQCPFDADRSCRVRQVVLWCCTSSTASLEDFTPATAVRDVKGAKCRHIVAF